jgi:hypothetical protein
VQDAEAFRDEQQVPDRIEERHVALDRGGGHGLALSSRELVTQLGHPLLELAGALLELSDACGRNALQRLRGGSVAGSMR